MGHTFGVRVDGASPRGLWPPAGGRLCRRVVFAIAQRAGKKVLKMNGPAAQGFLSLTALRAEGCGGGFAADFIKKGARLAPQVVQKGCVRFAQGATASAALKVVDCPSGNAYKASVTGFTFSVIERNKHSADWLAALATPYPGCAGLLHGKACHTILRSLCSLTNRVPLPPLFRGKNRFLCFPAETWPHG